MEKTKGTDEHKTSLDTDAHNNHIAVCNHPECTWRSRGYRNPADAEHAAQQHEAQRARAARWNAMQAAKQKRSA